MLKNALLLSAYNCVSSLYRIMITISCMACILDVVQFRVDFFFSVSYNRERPWWPTQGPSKGRKKKVKGNQESEIKSSLMTVD